MNQQPPSEFVDSLHAALDFWQRRIKSESPARLGPERHNLYRAVQFGLALPGTQSSAAAMAADAFPFAHAHGYWHEWLTIMEIAANVSSAAQLESRFWVLTRLGQLRRLSRKLSGALSAHREALDVARRTENPLLLAEAHYHLGRALRDARLYPQAQEQLQAGKQFLEQLQGIDAERLAANINNALGRVAHDLGRLSDAQTHLERAVSIRRKHGNAVLLADDLHDLGNVHRAASAYDMALAYYEEALALLEGTGHRLNRLLILHSMGVLYFARHNYVRAENVFREIDLPFLSETGNVHLQAIILLSLGNTLLYQWHYVQAAQMLRESVVLWRQLDDELELANAIGSLGEALAGLGQKNNANTLFLEALALLSRYPHNAKAGRLRALFAAEQQKVAG